MPSTIRRCNTDVSSRSTGSRTSDDSQDSQSTAPTLYSPRPSLVHAQTDAPIYSGAYVVSPATTYSSYYPRSSAETYKSEASQEDLFEEPEVYDPEYDVPEYQINEEVESNTRPSTTLDFADFFPTSRKLYIRHDDTTWDGNMNLRVDTEDTHSKHKANVQLFHMKLQDLKNRDFSLRRYERSSGREVCHSSRKYLKPSEQRPGLTRSMSNAFANIARTKPDFKRTNSTASTQSSRSETPARRQDSGYGSTPEEDDEVGEFMSEKQSSAKISTNTTKLEFSNYAQIDVKRCGAKSSKRYEFEYWGSTYTWKRVTEKDGAGKAVSYHLFKGESSRAVAHIVPEMRSLHQIEVEEAAGGWVPPCFMWISDKSVLEALTDVAE